LSQPEVASEGKCGQILDAAARVFAKYGFKKTNIGDVVREAAVARGTVYRYFGSKDELFHAVVTREGRELLEGVREAVAAESTTADRLRRAIITHTDLIQRKLNVMRISIEAAADIMSRWKHETDELHEDAIDLYAGIITDGVKRGEIRSEDPRRTALLLVHMLKGLYLSVLTGQVGSDRDELVDGVLDVMMNGLRPREEAS